MECIKDESDDMSDADACRVKDEDTEEQIGWWVFTNETVLSSNRVCLENHGSSGDWVVLSMLALLSVCLPCLKLKLTFGISPFY